MEYLISNIGDGFRLVAIKNNRIAKSVTYTVSIDVNPETIEGIMDNKYPNNSALENKNIPTFYQISLEEVKDMVAFAEKFGLEKQITSNEFISAIQPKTYGVRKYKGAPAVIDYTHYKAIVNKINN